MRAKPFEKLFVEIVKSRRQELGLFSAVPSFQHLALSPLHSRVSVNTCWMRAELCSLFQNHARVQKLLPRKAACFHLGELQWNSYSLASKQQNLSSSNLHSFSLVLPSRVTQILIPLRRDYPSAIEVSKDGVFISK